MIDLSSRRRIHVVGIGGAGMSAIATVLTAMGHEVSGSDLKASPGLARLRAAGVTVHVGHQRGHVPPGTDAVAVSSAIPSGNVELVAAREAGVPVVRRADVLASICATRRTVAVAGTHGKTTTTSMLALVLVEAGMHPSFIIGGDVNDIGGGAAWGEGEWFVVEADESDGTFLELGAEAVIVTSVERDHLDHYGSFEAIEAAFGRFLSDATGPKVVSADDGVAAALARSAGATTYGFDPAATFRITDLDSGRGGAAFTVVRGGEPLGRVQLPVPGAHNAANATAALAMGILLGAPFDAAARALARYGGVARRFEYRGERDGVTYVDDYAHNPGKVRAVLAAAKTGGWRRVVAVFQPHLYSRTADLAEEFGSSFRDADVVVVTDVYAAREQPRPGVTGKLIVDAVADADPGRRVIWCPSRTSLAAVVRSLLRPGDLCLTLGAGDLPYLHEELLAEPLDAART